ncbi:MAG: DHH family phosphoesterase [Desulfobacterales bacterium]|nr:DHH family phosphoesterase [Desulfobacterales bacterium]MDJ0912698.1 DHH family phosphoesterase [Desulfobacterales bacterium]
MEKIIQQLNNSRHVLVASHVNPDGDAVGSMLAMGLALGALNKHVTIYNESPIPAVYRFLAGVQQIVNHLAPDAIFDTALILDCGELERIGDVAPRIANIPVIINIDHHVTNSLFGHLQLIDQEACATTEILHRIIQQLGVPLTREIAASIYTGILTDTGSFRFSNTNQSAFAICDQMVRYGVNPHTIAQHVYGHYSLGRIKLLNLALDSIEVSDNGKVSLMTLTQAMLLKTRTRPEDIDGMINYARSIQDVKIAALIQEKCNGNRYTNEFSAPYHVSLRSDGSVDVAEIATDFGGGGHSSAAGFGIEGTLAEVKSRILGLADKL